jgi:WhiB family redox-sensing transcriptional regulator
MTNDATDWRAAGACLSADPDLFFPIATGVAVGRQISDDCRVRQQCLDFAMRTGETHGIWGGTTPEERISARRRRLRRHGARPSWQQAPGARAS